RHLLAPGGLAVVEGVALKDGPLKGAQVFDPQMNRGACKFTPDLHSLDAMLRCAYLEPVRHAWMATPPPPPPLPPPPPARLRHPPRAPPAAPPAAGWVGLAVPAADVLAGPARLAPRRR